MLTQAQLGEDAEESEGEGEIRRLDSRLLYGRSRRVVHEPEIVVLDPDFKLEGKNKKKIVVVQPASLVHSSDYTVSTGGSTEGSGSVVVTTSLTPSGLEGGLDEQGTDEDDDDDNDDDGYDENHNYAAAFVSAMITLVEGTYVWRILIFVFT